MNIITDLNLFFSLENSLSEKIFSLAAETILPEVLRGMVLPFQTGRYYDVTGVSVRLIPSKYFLICFKDPFLSFENSSTRERFLTIDEINVLNCLYHPTLFHDIELRYNHHIKIHGFYCSLDNF